MDFIDNITNRARVAFYLAIAEKMFIEIGENYPEYSFGRRALDKSWEWLEGKEISGYDLHEFVENEDDGGLMTIAGYFEDDPIRKSTWLTLTLALLYVTWKAYKLENVYPVPGSVNEVDETMINELTDYMEKCPHIEDSSVEKLKRHLIEKYQINAPDEFGDPITKKEIMNILK